MLRDQPTYDASTAIVASDSEVSLNSGVTASPPSPGPTANEVEGLTFYSNPALRRPPEQQHPLEQRHPHQAYPRQYPLQLQELAMGGFPPVGLVGSHPDATAYVPRTAVAAAAAPIAALDYCADVSPGFYGYARLVRPLRLPVADAPRRLLPLHYATANASLLPALRTRSVAPLMIPQRPFALPLSPTRRAAVETRAQRR